MKKIKLIFIVLLLNAVSYAQIDSLLGVYDIDSCKFENTCQMLLLDTSPSNIWEVGSPVKLFFNAAYSPTNAIQTRVNIPYDNSVHASFDVQVPNYAFTNMILGFKHKYQTDTLTDGGYVEVSYDKGLSWVNLAIDTNYLIYNSENLYTPQDTLKGGIYGFSGTSDGWVHTRIQWVWYMLTKPFPIDSVYFRFNFISDSIQTGKDGWMIDDLMISFADIPGSIVEKDDGKLLRLYPNPNDGNFNIDLKEQLQITIYNTLGKIVFNGLFNEGTHPFHLNHLINGVYIIEAEGKKTMDVLRMVVQR